MTRDKAIIILSGGLDSSVALCVAQEKYEVVLALTFDYGQRAAQKEKEAAKRFAEHYKIQHQFISLDWLKNITQTALVNQNQKLPQLKNEQLDQKEVGLESAKSVWVPNRNGVFISIAAAFADSLKAKVIITGFNAEEAATFPDNSAEYVKEANASLAYSTQVQCRVEAPTIEWNKREIVREAMKFNPSTTLRASFPFEWLWSCYEGGEKMCGKCESCLRSKRAYLENGLTDMVNELFL